MNKPKIVMAVTLIAVAGTAFHADQLISDDLIVDEHCCVGFDCVIDEDFGSDTLLLKENNLRIGFQDTSDPESLPGNDWRITANDWRNRGVNRFSIDDVDAPAIPFDRVVGTDVTTDAEATLSIGLGDLNNDTLVDLVAGNDGRNRLYLNNGATGFADPFEGVDGIDITEDEQATRALALGDVTGDSRLDFVAGNYGQPSRLYVNNNTAAPFDGVSGIDITAVGQMTTSVALGDFNRDFRVDLVVGNEGQPNLLYLSNGTANPFTTAKTITTDSDATLSLVTGDLTGDGRVDLVVGNRGRNRLYINNATSDPFNGVSGIDITTDSHDTTSVVLGDVNGDLALDLVAGNDGAPNRLYLNNGTANPFDEVSGIDITADSDTTRSVALADVNGDSLLDLVAGNDGPNRTYTNNGTDNPFDGVSGSDITADNQSTRSVAAYSTDIFLNFSTGLPFQNVSPFLAVGNDLQTNRVYSIGDGDEGTSPFTLEAGTPSSAIYVNDQGRVGLGTDTPAADAVLDVRGDVVVDGDIVITGGARGGIVRSNGRRIYTVTFARPYSTDYVIILTPVVRRNVVALNPTVLAQHANGFTFTIGGQPWQYVATHWMTRTVGEY